MLCLLRDTQLINPVSIRIPSEAKYGQAPGKCLLKPSAVLDLDSQRAIALLVAGLPTFHSGRNHDPVFNTRLYIRIYCGGIDCGASIETCVDPRRIELPLCEKPVGREPTLQSR